ncbi:MAG TPA: STAS domain-containing protein [Spirochaetota bacterium]|nr:STAS domain-containing protein [Spirochaetota bacterium]MBP9021663.1 STAS domain-containing protein [Spirochaetota bacterium]HOA07281.1 STAS domain-containing protein [Spirochaetota bacterium]HOF32479.1 STAS domain-containing protein [Spirochaetota bacterium]HOH36487.1 STAS domain-containing protein [Spirochaetota bacterium]
MDINITDSADSTIVVVKGDIEMMTIKDFKDKLLNLGQNSEKDIEIDLSGVDYIDSSGVGVLISLLKLQKKKGRVLKMSNVSEKVLDVLKLSSLADVFNL